jgi:hypothetical protein
MIAAIPTKTEIKIIDALPKMPTWFTVDDISATARIPKQTASLYAKEMSRAGKLVRGDRIWTKRNTFSYLYRAATAVVQIPIERPKPRNLFEAIMQQGHDEDWNPEGDSRFVGTGAEPGSDEKIEILRSRVELGHPLWHPDDRVDYHGCTGTVQPYPER